MPSKICKPNLCRVLIAGIIAMPFISGIVTEMFDLPVALLFYADLSWAVLTLLILKDYRRMFQWNHEQKILLFVTMAFLLSTFVGLILQYQSILYYLWGIRNNVGFFVFFYACILYLRKGDISKIWRIFDGIFWLNFVVTLFQFFILGYEQDYLGGIFGVIGGCNRSTNVFLVVVTVHSMLAYLNEEEKTYYFLLKCASALLIAAMAELKMYILEFGVITILALLFAKNSRRKLYLVVTAFVAIFLGIQILTWIFPGWSGWFRPSKILQTALDSSGYNGSGVEVNRLTAIPIAWNTYLTTWPQKLFGLGLGHCDFSSFSFLTTPFYLENANILYTWFYSGFLMLETGLVGVVLYCAFFAAVFFCSWRVERKTDADKTTCQTAKIMSLICLLMFVYDSSMRSYIAFVAFLVLALPFVQSDSRQECSSQL